MKALRTLALIVGSIILHLMLISAQELYIHYGVVASIFLSGMLGAVISSIRFGLSLPSTYNLQPKPIRSATQC